MTIRSTLAFMVIAGLFATVTARAAEIEIGTQAPDFSATGVDGEDYSLASTKGAKAVVVFFTCNSCPVAVAYEDRLIEFANQYADKGVQLIAINCNNRTEDLAAMKKQSKENGFSFPYVFDASGQSARDYGARVTPHFFILDGDRRIAYRGAFDDDMRKPTTHYVAAAVDAILEGETPATTTTKAFGCGIKSKR